MAESTPGHESDTVDKTSPRSVDETVSRLRDILDARGMRLFAVIDQSDEARRVGLVLRETVLVLFGSPEAGTPVMDAVPRVALDLPLKVLVWAEGDSTMVSYTSPSALAARHHLTADLAAPLAGIDALTDALVAP